MAFDDRHRPTPRQTDPLSATETTELLERFKRGDRAALDNLLARYIPRLRGWAHGRMPPSARGMLDTADLVQDAIVASLKHLNNFVPRHQGALQCYFRTAVMNRVNDLARAAKRGPQNVELQGQLPDPAPSPLALAIGAETVARYDAALTRLSVSDREAIVGRIEMQYSYEELAIVLHTSRDGARMKVIRAIRHLAQEMRDAG